MMILSHRYRTFVVQLSTIAALWLLPAVAIAQVYGGSGIEGGLGLLSGLDGIADETSVTAVILAIIAFILDIALLIAVVAIIVAGIYLIVSNGDEGQKDRAKRIIIYVIIGILLILLSRALVTFIAGIFG